jgi:predicted nucleotidyltransferase
MNREAPLILSAHPVAPEIRQRVLQTLEEVEARHEVRVLFACESGSRGWGFASPDSDYDVRFIYAHRLPWYLTVETGRDVIEQPISDELDVSGWELRKALRLLRRSNPTLLEWLDSPVVYRQDAHAAGRMRALAPTYFSTARGRYHYLAMARKNFRGYLQGDTVRLKKYLYVLRPLLAAQWIDQGRGMPPMRFADLVVALVHDEALLDEINRLLEIKMRCGEAEYSPRWERIHQFIEQGLARDETLPDYKKPRGGSVELDTFLLDTVTAWQQQNESKHGID